MKRLSGIVAPITTPFVDDEVSFEQFGENIAKYAQTSLSGLLVLGSNGENKSLTENEKLKIIETAVKSKGKHQIVMAGCGYESTKLTIEFSKKAQDLGADFVSLLTPFYFKKSLTDDVLADYYFAVAEALSIPALVYNAPGFTGITMSPSLLGKLSRHPNITGMKDTSPANIANYLEEKDENFDILAGTVNTLLPGLVLGAAGGVVSLADAFPEKCCELYDQFKKNNLKEAVEVHHVLFRLNQSVSGKFGVAGVKYAMDAAGFHGGAPRKPLRPITDAGKKAIDEAIAAAGLK